MAYFENNCVRLVAKAMGLFFNGWKEVAQCLIKVLLNHWQIGDQSAVRVEAVPIDQGFIVLRGLGIIAGGDEWPRVIPSDPQEKPPQLNAVIALHSTSHTHRPFPLAQAPASY